MKNALREEQEKRKKREESRKYYGSLVVELDLNKSLERKEKKDLDFQIKKLERINVEQGKEIDKISSGVEY